MVVTIHEVFGFCWRSISLFSFFSLSGLFPGPVFDFIYVDHAVFLLGVVSLGLLMFSVDKLGGFVLVLDGDFVLFPVCIDF